MMTKMRFRALPMVVMAVAPAHAATVTTSDIFKQFNAVVFGSFFTTSDVEGRAIIGGNMGGGATFNLNPVSLAAMAASLEWRPVLLASPQRGGG